MRVTLRVALYSAAIATLLACASTSKDDDPQDATGAIPSQTAPTTPATPTVASALPTAKPSETAASVDFKMPSFKGMTLQKAQDKVQEFGIFFSKSHDLRGNRNQLVDSNWQVCTQTPAAGTHMKGQAADFEGKIDFGVVKLTEKCP